MQEPFNEAIATMIMEGQSIPCAHYDVIWIGGDPCSICRDFVTRDTELVTAYHLIKTRRRPNHVSLYGHYVDCCKGIGLDIVPDLDRMIAIDFLMANTDRHLNNFGVIRNAETLEWLGAAPIYDTGSSLAFDEPTGGMSPDMEPRAKPFRDTTYEELDLVSSFDWVDLDALRDVIPRAEELLGTSGSRIDNRRREAILGLLSRRMDRFESRVRDSLLP